MFDKLNFGEELKKGKANLFIGELDFAKQKTEGGATLLNHFNKLIFHRSMDNDKALSEYTKKNNRMFYHTTGKRLCPNVTF